MWWCGGIITIVFIVGGWDGASDRAEILAFDGEDWKEIGELHEARENHAATKIDATNIIEFCNKN